MVLEFFVVSLGSAIPESAFPIVSNVGGRAIPNAVSCIETLIEIQQVINAYCVRSIASLCRPSVELNKIRSSLFAC